MNLELTNDARSFLENLPSKQYKQEQARFLSYSEIRTRRMRNILKVFKVIVG